MKKPALSTTERMIAALKKRLLDTKSKSPWLHHKKGDYAFVRYELIERATKKVIDSGEELVGPLFYEGQNIFIELQRMLKRKHHIHDTGIWYYKKDCIYREKRYGKCSKKYHLKAKNVGSIDITGFYR